MISNKIGIKQAKRAIMIVGIIIMLLGAFVQQGRAQIAPFYPSVFPYYGGFPIVAPPPLYGSLYGYLPTRSAAVLLSTSTLLPTLLTTPTTTTTATPVIGVSTAITLATLGGTGLSSTTLATLAATPVPTTVTTTPTIGTTTALLLSGGVSTSTLLLLGI
ncbi:MAG: hypothetical protein AB1847_14115 [bacterium]